MFSKFTISHVTTVFYFPNYPKVHECNFSIYSKLTTKPSFVTVFSVHQLQLMVLCKVKSQV